MAQTSPIETTASDTQRFDNAVQRLVDKIQMKNCPDIVVAARQLFAQGLPSLFTGQMLVRGAIDALRSALEVAAGSEMKSPDNAAELAKNIASAGSIYLRVRRTPLAFNTPGAQNSIWRSHAVHERMSRIEGALTTFDDRLIEFVKTIKSCQANEFVCCAESFIEGNVGTWDIDDEVSVRIERGVFKTTWREDWDPFDQTIVSIGYTSDRVFVALNDVRQSIVNLVMVGQESKADAVTSADQAVTASCRYLSRRGYPDVELMLQNKDKVGPEQPNAFWWNGKPYPLSGNMLSVVDYLWSKPKRTAKTDDLCSAVWDDEEAADDKLRGVRARLNRFFEKNDLPFQFGARKGKDGFAYLLQNGID